MDKDDFACLRYDDVASKLVSISAVAWQTRWPSGEETAQIFDYSRRREETPEGWLGSQAKGSVSATLRVAQEEEVAPFAASKGC